MVEHAAGDCNFQLGSISLTFPATDLSTLACHTPSNFKRCNRRPRCEGHRCDAAWGVAANSWHERLLSLHHVKLLSNSLDPAASASYKAVESYSFRILTLAAAALEENDGLECEKWATLLLNLLQYASPRCQRCCARMLRIILPRMSPADLVSPPVLQTHKEIHKQQQTTVAGSGCQGCTGVWKGRAGSLEIYFSTCGHCLVLQRNGFAIQCCCDHLVCGATPLL